MSSVTEKSIPLKIRSHSLILILTPNNCNNLLLLLQLTRSELIQSICTCTLCRFLHLSALKPGSVPSNPRNLSLFRAFLQRSFPPFLAKARLRTSLVRQERFYTDLVFQRKIHFQRYITWNRRLRHHYLFNPAQSPVSSADPPLHGNPP